MPHYNFIAKDQLGRNYKGSLYGATEQAVFFRLQKLGYVVHSVTEKDETGGYVLFPQKITVDDVVVFTKLFSTVTATGMPAVDALAALEEQTENVSFKRVIKEIRQAAEDGVTLSEAFAKHHKVFPHFYVSMLKSGEAAGNISDVLESLTKYLERDVELKRAIASAFTYPKMVLSIAAAAVCVFILKVVPAFSDIYAQSNIKLPASTRFLMGISTFLIDNWITCIGGIIVVWIAFILFKTGPQTKPIYDRIMMSMPFFGPVTTRIAVSRSIHTLGSMLACGVPLITSLETVRNIMNNVCISNDLQRVIESVETGGTISAPLRLSRHFSPLVTYMIAAGEQSGRLPEMLEGCANALEKEISHLIKRLLLVLEPALTVFLVFVIGFIIIAMYMPVLNIITSTPF